MCEYDGRVLAKKRLLPVPLFDRIMKDESRLRKTLPAQSLEKVEWEIMGEKLKLFSLLLHAGKPCLVGRVLPTHNGKEGLLQSLRDWTWPTGSDTAIVDLPHRCEFGSGSRHEHFVGNIHVISREALLHHRDMLLPRQVDDGASGNAVEDRGERRGLHLSFTHNEDILPCPF